MHKTAVLLKIRSEKVKDSQDPCAEQTYFFLQIIKIRPC
jgi:hypothetical protein